MNDNIIAAFNNFQIADLDDDMIGMYKALVDWLRVIRSELPNGEFPDEKAPDNYYKLDPHQPRMELRINTRKFLAYATKFQEETDEEIKLINLYTAVLATAYIYHMPAKKLEEDGKSTGEYTRAEAEKRLLTDNMSPNWIKEPSLRDFTAIML